MLKSVSETEQVVSAVYPNPTQGLVSIEAEGIMGVSIFNSLGQKVFESEAGGNAFAYDLGQHGAGLYILKIETAQGVATKRVTVL